MSKTNVKKRQEANPLEFYPTHKECTRALLRQTEVPLPTGGQWLEPCVGSGSILKAADAYWEETKTPPPRWDVMDINPAHAPALSLLRPSLIDKMHFGDARTLRFGDFGRTTPWQVGCTNPPFSLAAAILSALRPLCDMVVLLLRVGFLETKKHYPWLSQDVPDLGILCPRPSFDGEGNDAATYAWMFWGKERKKVGKVFLLPCRDSLLENSQLPLLPTQPIAV